MFTIKKRKEKILSMREQTRNGIPEKEKE